MKRYDLILILIFIVGLYLSFNTAAFAWVWGFVAIYIYGYVNHRVECSRYEHSQALERKWNAFHRLENNIKKLHRHGTVFTENT